MPGRRVLLLVLNLPALLEKREMSRLPYLLLFTSVVVASTTVAAPDTAPDTNLPLGLWRIEFSNGIVESCESGREPQL
jgi:hypothetical protein